MFKRIIAATLLLSIFNSSYSQVGNDQEFVSVKLDIVGKGAPAICANVDASDYYFATVNIVNTQDSTVTFFIMSCSWPMDGFIIKSDSIAFQFCFAGCDHNVPEKITVPPKKSVQFYGTINSWKKSSAIAKIKVGFRYFATVDDLWSFGGTSADKKRYKLFWSNEVELKDSLYSYEVK